MNDAKFTRPKSLLEYFVSLVKVKTRAQLIEEMITILVIMKNLNTNWERIGSI